MAAAGTPAMLIHAPLRALGSAHPAVVDGLLAVGILALSLPRVLDRRDWLVNGLLVAALVLPLAWRRRHPSAVFIVCASAAFVQWIVGVQLLADVALLVALYSVAVREPGRRIAAAVLVMELGAVLATTRWPQEHALQAFVGLSALVTAACVLGISVRNRRALLASLEERAARLEVERDQQGRLAAAAERARIAREMHDIVAHNLTVIIALADGAKFAAVRSPDRAALAMETVSDTGRQALAEMRGLLGVLRDDARLDRHPQPGLEQIDLLLEQVRAAGLPTTLEVSGELRPFATGLQLSVFRILQEALTNTLKHGGPSAAAHVCLTYEPDAIEIEVRDTGAGVPAQAGGGRGLSGMRERSAVFGGVVEAGPQRQGGWRVHTRLSAHPEGALA